MRKCAEFNAHKADGAPDPAWIRKWLEDAAGGEMDMTLYYPTAS